jgi:hypothetical protein
VVARPRRAKHDYLIVLAEIYPSLLSIQPTAEGVKDAVQVRSMAARFAMLDDAWELRALFAGPTCLTPEDRDRIEREEGWTLGVLTGRDSGRVGSEMEIGSRSLSILNRRLFQVVDYEHLDRGLTPFQLQSEFLQPVLSRL